MKRTCLDLFCRIVQRPPCNPRSRSSWAGLGSWARCWWSSGTGWWWSSGTGWWLWWWWWWWYWCQITCSSRENFGGKQVSVSSPAAAVENPGSTNISQWWKSLKRHFVFWWSFSIYELPELWPPSEIAEPGQFYCLAGFPACNVLLVYHVDNTVVRAYDSFNVILEMRFYQPNVLCERHLSSAPAL